MDAANTSADLFIGLMSGTSLDGIDAVLVDFSCHPPALLASYYAPYPRRVARQILELCEKGHDELHRAALLGNELAHLYHAAVAELLRLAAIPATAVRAIGCHGQTIRHNPSDGYTVQIGNPDLLAELCNICVVADFRGRDIAAGGQGAPLVPAFHDCVFRAYDRHRVILNIGGISNLTDLKPDSPARGFDCGPGNVLLDAWIQKTKGAEYDDNGTWACSGRVIAELLLALMAHPFFAHPPPKSCGREDFSLKWLESKLRDAYKAEDVQATLLELTACTVSQAIRRWCNRPDEIAVCGGGAHNAALLQRLAAHLPGIRIMRTDELGIGVDWVEAVAFAWLARQRLSQKPGNLPAVTGATGARVLGALYAR